MQHNEWKMVENSMHKKLANVRMIKGIRVNGGACKN